VAQQSDRPKLAWTFIVLDTDGVNAFASPGGFVHITRGALGLISNEAELAAVLPKQALPPLDLGPERVEVLRASHSFELDPGLLDVDLVLDRQLLGAGEG